MTKVVTELRKNKLWSKGDKIAVICCSNKAYECSPKEIKTIFDKTIYFPYPNYPTRKLLLKKFIE